MMLSRRRLLKLSAVAAPVTLAGRTDHRQQPVPWRRNGQWRHGLSLFGDLKYPPDFKHFDYVNPDAPKGGRLRLYGVGSFDSLNPYTYKGEAAAMAANNESADDPVARRAVDRIRARRGRRVASGRLSRPSSIA